MKGLVRRVSNQLIVVDPKFTAYYTVVIKLWNKTDIKTYNYYNNLGLKMSDQDDLFEFEKTFSNVQDAVAFFIIQQEILEVECIIICEYCYEDKVVATEYIEDINVAFRAIADKRYSGYIKSKDMTIEMLEEQIKMVKPVLELPQKEIDSVLQYVESYNNRTSGKVV